MIEDECVHAALELKKVTMLRLMHCHHFLLQRAMWPLVAWALARAHYTGERGNQEAFGEPSLCQLPRWCMQSGACGLCVHFTVDCREI